MKLFYNFAITYSILIHIINAENKSENEEVQNKNNNFSNNSPSELELHAYTFCKHEEYPHKLISQANNNNKSQMIWVIWNRTKAGEKAVLPNNCSVNDGLPLRRHCRNFNGTAVWEKYNNETVLLDCRISMFCETELFHHYITNNSGKVDRHQNVWKRTKIGEYSSPRDLCLKPNGLHLTRHCYYDVKDQKAKWVAINNSLNDIKCLLHVQQQIISNELNRLYENITALNFMPKDMAMHRRKTCETVWNLLKKPKTKLLPADVQLTGNILKHVLSDSEDSKLSRDVLRITHSLMSSDAVILRLSAELNATNSLLETFENYMDGLAKTLVSNTSCYKTSRAVATAQEVFGDYNETSVEILNLSHIGVYAYIMRNISIFFVNPSCSLISGIAIYNSYRQEKYKVEEQRDSYTKIRYDSLKDLYYRFILMNDSIHDLLKENYLELASFMPIDGWSSLQRSSHNNSLLDTPLLVFKIYAHDGLFIEKKLSYSRKPFGRVLSISVPGFTDKLPAPLPFIFHHRISKRSLSLNPNTGCGYWNYSTWISTGVYTNSSQYSTADDLILCYTNHLTQFTYLLGGTYRQNDLTDEVLVIAAHQQALDIISLIGCSLSLLGLLGIFITALLFKSWRSQASNKVLLNMCVPLTLQMVLFLFVNTDNTSEALVQNRSYRKCIVFGALLQYSILVLFTWMLIVAVLQFQRYVTVIGIQRPKHYILKSALLAWSLPLIPTLLVALLEPKSYIPNSYQLATDTGICYPSGSGLHYGVILPVSFIVLANLLIFIRVFYSISHALSSSTQRHEKQMAFKQLRLCILLFFLLGISWIFGLFAFIKAGIIFSYLFCITATLQGFVLCIYFVIIDENARNNWRKIFCSSRAKKKTVEKTTELQSMTTATTSLHTHENSAPRDR